MSTSISTAIQSIPDSIVTGLHIRQLTPTWALVSDGQCTYFMRADAMLAGGAEAAKILDREVHESDRAEQRSEAYAALCSYNPVMSDAEVPRRVLAAARRLLGRRDITRL